MHCTFARRDSVCFLCQMLLLDDELLTTLRSAERRVGANEKPVLLQKRRFEQAGYTELDKLEDLGREDNSYLCKLVYKATHASISAGVSGSH